MATASGAPVAAAIPVPGPRRELPTLRLREAGYVLRLTERRERHL